MTFLFSNLYRILTNINWTVVELTMMHGKKGPIMSITFHKIEAIDALPKGDAIQEISVKKQDEQQLGESGFSLVRDSNSQQCEILSDKKSVLTFKCTELPGKVVVGDFDDNGKMDIGLMVEGKPHQSLSFENSFMAQLSCWWNHFGGGTTTSSCIEIVKVGKHLEIAKDPGANSFNRLLATNALFKMGITAVAKEAYLSIAKDPEANLQDRLLATNALSKAGVAAMVEEAYLAIAKDSKAGGDDRLAAATTLSDMGQKALAEEAYLAIAKDSKAGGDDRFAAAMALRHMGQKALAEEVYLAIAKDSTVSGYDKLRAAKALRYMGQKALAEEVYLAIAKDSRANGYDRLAAAMVLFNVGQKALAEEAYLAIAKDPRVEESIRTRVKDLALQRR
jgi:hypothetical protein